jgi:SAM-dependent methyltransferase
LDLGCGPGSLTVRLLRRFPRARAVAVDFDPVVLRVGRGALRSLRERITWVDANLGADRWTTRLPRGRFDAAVSTTALHWLGPGPLGRVYRDVGRLLKPGGVFLNGDYLPWDAKRRTLRRLAERVRRNASGGKSLTAEWGPWRRWWKDIQREPALQEDFRERKVRFPNPHGAERELSLDFHERALRRAGFREVGVVWQEMENRILLGVR